jgi:hypothetical protein
MRPHLLLVPLLALALASCGGSDTPSSSGPSEADADAARVRLQECLREQGIDAGDGGVRTAPQDELDEAMEACDAERQAAFGDLDDADRQELQDQVTRLTQCMRDQGVDVPDIEVGQGAFGQIDPDDPDVQAALDACRDEVPDLGMRP